MDKLLVYTGINRIDSPGDILCIVEKIQMTSNCLDNKYGHGKLINKIGYTDNLMDLITSWILFYKLEQCTRSGFKFRIKDNHTENSHLEIHTDEKICSVDPLNCTDIDDCFHYVKIDGIYHIYIHISNVAYHILNNFVSENCLKLMLDKPFSLYLPHNKSYHMLHATLVGQLSLTVGQIRNVITLELLV